MSPQLKSNSSDFKDAPPVSLSLSHFLTVVSAFLIKLILWPPKGPHLIMPSSFETFNAFPSCFQEKTLLGSNLTPFLCLLPSLWCRCSPYLPESFLCLGHSSYLPECSQMFLNHLVPKYLSDISQIIDSELVLLKNAQSIARLITN